MFLVIYLGITCQRNCSDLTEGEEEDAEVGEEIDAELELQKDARV